MHGRLNLCAVSKLMSGGAVALLLAGCETYEPLSLPQGPNLLDRLPIATPGQSLNMDEVATIAVINNADLKSARFKIGVAEAQLFQAGILPNPQLNAELLFPSNQEPKPVSLGEGQERPGPGFAYGLSYDFQNLITQGAKVAAADAARDQQKLNILWQEWQTVSQARTLYVTGANAAEKRMLYLDAQQRYAAQSERSQRALQSGDITFDAAGTDPAALLDAPRPLLTPARTPATKLYNLRALLGLSQNVDVTFSPLGLSDIPDRAAVGAALARVAQLRPHLRA